MKLYWRIKVDGKWTWRPAQVVDSSWHEGHKIMTKHVIPHLDEGSRREHGNGADPEPLE